MDVDLLHAFCQCFPYKTLKILQRNRDNLLKERVVSLSTVVRWWHDSRLVDASGVPSQQFNVFDLPYVSAPLHGVLLWH
jgi:hypothetical protein